MFQHPSHARRARAAYGCACGCGTCAPKDNYGFALLAAAAASTEGVIEPKWAWDTSYYDSCPEYKKKVDSFEKTRKKYENLPSVFGLRTGRKASDYAHSMNAAKRDGENARKRCESKEFSTEGAPQALTIEQAKQQIGLTDVGTGGEEEDGLKPLLYVGAAGVLAVGGLIVWKLVKKSSKAKSTSNQKVSA